MAFSVAAKTKEAKEGVVLLLTSLVGVSKSTAETIAARLPAKECKLLLAELRAIEFNGRLTVDASMLNSELSGLDPSINPIVEGGDIESKKSELTDRIHKLTLLDRVICGSGGIRSLMIELSRLQERLK